MFNKFRMLPLTICTALMLQACGGDDDYVATVDAPKQVLDISANVYAQLRASSADANTLFAIAGTVAGTGAAVGDEPCQVKLHKMAYDTVGGAGEATTSSGAVMVPYGTNPACNGPRPVVLYAHGTSADRDFDFSKIISDPSNGANGDGAIILAMYAAQGYIVVAPNYAGYSDSALSYHPFLDKVQQSTEMVDALSHFRTHAATIGADASSKLFVSGLSAGGHVAMATHEALEARGETVTASLPISGPYAMLDFIDTLVAGYVNAGSTLFAPMYFTAAQKRENIYSDPSEIYSAMFADDAENSLPRPGGFVEAVVAGSLPQSALFNIDSKPTPVSPAPPLNAVNDAGYGNPFLVADSFRNAYLVDAATNGDVPQNSLRVALQNDDLRTDWSPASPVFMCGSAVDLTVYYTNSIKMAAHLDSPLVTNLELGSTASGTPALVQAQWSAAVQGGTDWFIAASQAQAVGNTPPAQPAGSISPTQVHGQTGAYCAAIALGLFNSL